MDHREICPSCKGEGRVYNYQPPEFDWIRCLTCFGSGWLLVEDLFVFQEEYDLHDGNKLWVFKRKGDPRNHYTRVDIGAVV